MASWEPVGWTLAELDQALQLIAQECQGTSFGIDLLIPERYGGSEEGGLALETLQRQIPKAHRDFVEGLLDQYQVPALPASQSQKRTTLTARAGVTISHKHSSELVDIAFSYPIKLLVNALGFPGRVCRLSLFPSSLHLSGQESFCLLAPVQRMPEIP